MIAVRNDQISETLQSLKSLTPQIISLCKILGDVGIDFFTYSRLDENDKGIFLCNNDQWYDVKFQNNLFDYNGFITVPELNQEGFTKALFFGDPSPRIKVLDFLYQMNLWNSIDLYRCIEHYKEVFHFCSHRDTPQMIDFYINNIHFLEGFSYFFKDKIQKTLENQTLKITIDIKNSQTPEVKETAGFILNPEMVLSQKAIFNLKGKDISFSLRQLQCLFLLSSGKTAKEIGRLLNLSYRTIEGYMEHLKVKLECPTRRDVLELLWSNDHMKAFLKAQKFQNPNSGEGLGAKFK